MLFNVRDADNRAHVAVLSFPPTHPQGTIELFPSPILSPGELGAFDESGVSVGNCLTDEAGQWRLYYLGWTLSGRSAYYNSIGLAIGASPWGPFERYSIAPILGRSREDPYSLSYPWIWRENDGRWSMIYGATIRWLDRHTMLHELRTAASDDGLCWRPTGRALLPLAPGEIAHARPCLLRSHRGYELWFSVKTADGYRIGYASSDDGLRWQRADEIAGLEPGREAWEDREVCYPAVIDFDDQRYLFYCGNGYGRSGFGWAVWSHDHDV
ncbi:MAG: hypothetical protein N2441_06265 [Rhodocyclaceae bacterium]|nr:hypothetical protein [Rhodocyclaceae bacterium]